MEPSVSRELHQVIEPLHAMVYFSPEAHEEYAAAGLDVPANRAAAYFPPRAACMGAVGPEVVLATFFNFSPAAVALGMAGAWDRTTPERLVAARYRGADRALRRLLGDEVDSPGVAEAAGLAAAAVTGCRWEGRPLAAATAGVPVPEGPPHLVLWHYLAVLREYRGDGHIAVLTAQGSSGLEALFLHAATGKTFDPEILRRSRGYSHDEWAAVRERLQEQGLVDASGSLTAAAVSQRSSVELATDRLALPAWEALGPTGCTRLLELLAPWSRAVLDAGGLPGRTRKN